MKLGLKLAHKAASLKIYCTTTAQKVIQRWLFEVEAEEINRKMRRPRFRGQMH
jgi:hypothetical protein